MEDGKQHHNGESADQHCSHVSYGYPPPPCAYLPPPAGCPNHGYTNIPTGYPLPSAPQQQQQSPKLLEVAAPQLQQLNLDPKVGVVAPSAPPEQLPLSPQQVGTGAPSALQQQTREMLDQLLQHLPKRVKAGPPSVGEHVLGALAGLCTGLVTYFIVAYGEH